MRLLKKDSCRKRYKVQRPYLPQAGSPDSLARPHGPLFGALSHQDRMTHHSSVRLGAGERVEKRAIKARSLESTRFLFGVDGENQAVLVVGLVVVAGSLGEICGEMLPGEKADSPTLTALVKAAAA